MQPLVRAALAVGALAVISGVAAERAASRPPQGSPTDPEAESGEALARMPCGPRQVPEGDACVPLPDRPPTAGSASPSSGASPDAPEGLDPDEPSEGARLPRRPDRPADVARLRLPLEGDPLPLDPAGVPLRGVDLDLTVLRLGAPRGTPVRAQLLEAQEGAFEILAVENLEGRGLAVVALARTKESKREVRSLVVWGALDGAGPDVARGAKLGEGQVVGFSGALPGGAGAAGEHLRFEVRRLRPDVDVAATPLVRLLGDAESIAIDVRNVLAPK